MDALAVTAITDFLLAGEALFLAGRLVHSPKARLSAAWCWCGVLVLLGLGGMLAGIDHGFIEPAGLSRVMVQRASWWVLGAMTLAMMMTIATQYFEGRAARRVALAGVLQFGVFSAVVPCFDSYVIVIVNYAPVMAWLLVLSLPGTRRGRGSRGLFAGLLTLATASAVQASGFDALEPLDHNVLYHLLAMPGVLLLYVGGRDLRTTAVLSSPRAGA